MARKSRSRSLPSPALDGAVEGEVTLAYLAPSLPGARPAPYLNIRFVNEAGHTLSFPMTARGAADFLGRLNSLLALSLVKFRSLSIGDDKHPVRNRFRSRPDIQHYELSGFRAVTCNLATSKQLRRLRQQAGVTTTGSEDVQFNMVWIEIGTTNKWSNKVEAELVMDLWAASAFRDGIYAALNASMPHKSPNDRDVLTVDGVVGTFET